MEDLSELPWGKIIIGVLLAIVAIFAIRWACVPAAVVDEVLDPSAILHKYEWFHDVNQAVEARVAQIQDYKKRVQEETDKDEKIRLKTELAGMQQVCRETVGQYNANSSKTNVEIFKGRTAPLRLDPARCE